MPSWFTRPLRVGDTGRDVEVVQRKLGSRVSGVFDDGTARRVRGLQRRVHLPQTGEVDTGTADAIGERADAGMTPDWFTRSLRLGDDGEDVARLRELLGLPAGSAFTAEVDEAVRRFQSSRQVTPTGVVDAIAIVHL